jgi:hypothetical protein
MLGWCDWDSKHIYTILNGSDEGVLPVILVISWTSSILRNAKAKYKPSGAKSGPSARWGTSTGFGPLQKANRFIVPVIGTNSFQRKSLVTYVPAEDGSRSSHPNVVFCYTT